jgi:hypothetical protein
MKKLILILSPLSFFALAYNPAQSTPELNASVPREIVNNKQQNNTIIKLVSPDSQTEIPMGDAEIILEVVDSSTGKPLNIENLNVSATMPMEGMEDMINKVEVQPEAQPGRFKATTYFGMQGTWKVVATVQDAQYQSQQEFIFQVK